MRLDIYVNYRGNCEQAFRFYEEHLGGRMTGIVRHGEQPNPNVPADWKDKVVHARLEIGTTVLMGADIPHEGGKDTIRQPLRYAAGPVRHLVDAVASTSCGAALRRRARSATGSGPPRLRAF